MCIVRVFFFFFFFLQCVLAYLDYYSMMQIMYSFHLVLIFKHQRSTVAIHQRVPGKFVTSNKPPSLKWHGVKVDIFCIFIISNGTVSLCQT